MHRIVRTSMTRTVVATLILCAIVVPSAAFAQPSRSPAVTSPPISITGRVIDAHSGDAIRNARVTITPVVPGAPVVLTDADGRFALPMPAGRYEVSASKTGYARHPQALVPAGAVVDIPL